MNAKLRKRISDAKAAHPEMFGAIQRHSHGGIECVRCKATGAALQSLVEDDRSDTHKEVNGKTVIIRQAQLMPTNEYDELVIEMSDGSLHETPIAKSRKRRGFTPEELEAIYAADLEEWAQDGMAEDLLNRYAERKPVRVV